MHRIPRGSLAALIALALGAALTAAVTGGNPSGGRGTGTPAPAEAARAASGTFSKRVVAACLGDPHEIVRAPDGALWGTEKSGRKVTRVDPASGAKPTLLGLPQAVHGEGGQDGVLGMAVERREDGGAYAYIAYSYDIDPAPAVRAAPGSSAAPTTPAASGCTARRPSSPACRPATTTSRRGCARARTASCTTPSATRA
ncbi:hypothetical protein GCM10023238_32650 [Streptomyces heliomycini]